MLGAIYRARPSGPGQSPTPLSRPKVVDTPLPMNDIHATILETFFFGYIDRNIGADETPLLSGAGFQASKGSSGSTPSHLARLKGFYRSEPDLSASNLPVETEADLHPQVRPLTIRAVIAKVTQLCKMPPCLGKI
jgi:hypothetical protein